MRENFGKGMGGHHSPRSVKDEWLTPPEFIQELGPFDLDPCAPVTRPWPTASNHFTILDDGLSKEWFGRVWMNPPYGKATGDWLAKLAAHGDGIALVFARTETKTWHTHIWPRAQGILFLAGRINFHHVSGQRALKNCGAPCTLIAFGDRNEERLKRCSIVGHYVQLNPTNRTSQPTLALL